MNPSDNDAAELESLEKVLGFQTTNSGADMRITIGSRNTWVNSSDAIAFRDKILAWHNRLVETKVREAQINVLSQLMDINDEGCSLPFGESLWVKWPVIEKRIAALNAEGKGDNNEQLHQKYEEYKNRRV